MRTDNQKKLEVPKAEHSSDCKETMKIARKTLHPLQIAAGDKENLVGAGRMPSTKSEKDGKISATSSKQTNPSPKKDNQKLSKQTNPSPKKDKHKLNKPVEKKTITEEDLTSEAGPSEHYWELLAETRRKALEKALKENQQLHERIKKLTEDKENLQGLLDEAQGIIDTLNEIVAEMGDENEHIDDDDVSRRA